jgi:hypothetical protein
MEHQEEETENPLRFFTQPFAPGSPDIAHQPKTGLHRPVTSGEMSVKVHVARPQQKGAAAVHSFKPR